MQTAILISKSETSSLRKPKVTQVSLETLQPIIARLFKGPDAVFTADELAEIFGKHSRTIYHYGTGQVRLSIPQFITIVRESAKRGNFELLDLQLPEDISLMPTENSEVDGDVDDELGDLIEDGGKMREALNDGRLSTAKIMHHRMKKDIARVGREIKERERA